VSVATGCYCCLVERDRLQAAVQAIAGEVERFERSYQAWQQAVAHRDRVVAEAESKVMIATGGFGLRRFGLACGRAGFNSKREAMSTAQAIRARPAVLAAVALADNLRSAEDAAVLVSRREVAIAAGRVLLRGRVAQELTGLELAEIRRLSHLPTEASGDA
jgi:hypothetical protein